MKLFVIDTETGGLHSGYVPGYDHAYDDPSTQSILSLGGVVWNRDTGEIEDEIELFIKEDPVIAVPSALKANQIDLEWLNENGLTPKEAVKDKLAPMLVKHFGQPSRQNLVSLTGYNLKFDEGFLRRLVYKAGLYPSAFDERFAYPKACSFEFMRFMQMVMGLPLDRCKLETVMEYLGITPYLPTHSALNDAKNTVQVMNKLRQDFPVGDWKRA
jgi:DNA polymerase III epsilon subunit-like protein